MCAFDLVVAGESAKFTMGYTKAAMTPDGTSTYFLARHIGLRRAMELTLTNRVLSAQEALDWGLVNMVVPDDEVSQNDSFMRVTSHPLKRLVSVRRKRS
jgi:2-(1,2-epoxy-1,2-dihydrophenyl)acetyl-CoA isomerase